LGFFHDGIVLRHRIRDFSWNLFLALLFLYVCGISLYVVGGELKIENAVFQRGSSFVLELKCQSFSLIFYFLFFMFEKVVSVETFGVLLVEEGCEYVWLFEEITVAV